MTITADPTFDPAAPPTQSIERERYRFLTGIAFAVLFLAAFVVGGTAPTVASSTRELISYYSGHRGAVLVSSMLFVYGVVFEVLFGVAIANRLRRDGQRWLGALAIAGVVMVGTMQLVLTAMGALLSYSVASLGDAAVVKAVFDLQWMLDVFAGVPTAIYFAAVASGLRRTDAIPRWLSGAGLGVAGLWILRSTTWARSGFWSPTGGLVFVAVLVSLLWVSATSAVLHRRAHADAARA